MVQVAVTGETHVSQCPSEQPVSQLQLYPWCFTWNKQVLMRLVTFKGLHHVIGKVEIHIYTVLLVSSAPHWILLLQRVRRLWQMPPRIEGDNDGSWRLMLSWQPGATGWGGWNKTEVEAPIGLVALHSPVRLILGDTNFFFCKKSCKSMRCNEFIEPSGCHERTSKRGLASIKRSCKAKGCVPLIH